MQENVPLAPLTTFRLGGAARFFVAVRDQETLRLSLAFARERQLPLLLLGGGSNLLVGEKGFDGLVLKIELKGVQRQANTYVVAAGESWDELVARSVGDALWGLENLSGIPGTVGGAVVQNIGAYGAVQSEALEWVDVFDAKTLAPRRLNGKECGFGYRESIFKHEPDLVVVRAAYTLSAEPRPTLSYKDLRHLEGQHPSQNSIREAVLAVRREKFPDLTKEGTAGSYFKNPLMPKEEAQRFIERYPGLPLFEMPESGDVKVPLAWLLDRVLEAKGWREGGARLFERQPLVIAADFTAQPKDVSRLAEKVKDAVRKTFQIELEEEVRIVA